MRNRGGAGFDEERVGRGPAHTLATTPANTSDGAVAQALLHGAGRYAAAGRGTNAAAEGSLGNL